MSDQTAKVIRPSISRYALMYCSAYAIVFLFSYLLFGLPSDFPDLSGLIWAVFFLVVLPVQSWFVSRDRVSLVLQSGLLTGPVGHLSRDEEIVQPQRISFSVSEIDKNRTSPDVPLFGLPRKFHIWNKKGDSIVVELLFFWPSQLREFLANDIPDELAK